MSSAEQSGAERALLAAGTMCYHHGPDFEKPLAELDGVPGALRSVVETLTGFGYAPEAGDYLLNPCVQRLRESIRSVAGSASVVVVYYTGHGVKPEGSPYYLLTRDSRPDRLSDTALEVRQLPDLAFRRDQHGRPSPREEQPHVLVILDSCFSGSGGIEALHESLQAMGNPNVWIWASASSVEYAQQGRFAEALGHVLNELVTGPSQQFLSLDVITNEVGKILRQKTPCFPPGGQFSGLTPFFPNPDHEPDLAGLTIAEQHWRARLRGVPDEGRPTGFYITGRTGRVRAVEDLARWMRRPESSGLTVVTGAPGSGKSALPVPGLAVVTGSAGTGKSTLLALPVLLTEAGSREILLAGATPDSLVARAARQFDGLPVLAVHARGMNTDQVAQAIARLLGRPPNTAASLVEDLGEQDGAPRWIVIVDAVDQARDPEMLLSYLLTPLARRGLRIVAGTRRTRLLAQVEPSLTVDLDAGPYRDPQALADYARQLLVAAHEADVPTPYRDRGDDLAGQVAAAIADKATVYRTAGGQTESFLLAQLLARTVRGRRQAIDVTSDWTEQLPDEVGVAFDEDLARLGEREPAARALLAALAWARGLGLPWENIWLPVAEELAVLSETSTPRVQAADLRWLLNEVGAYIVEDLGPGGRSVFRPFHDLLSAHLREGPGSERAERAVTAALRSTIPLGRPGRSEWPSAHPYLRTYLAQHAAAAGSQVLSALAENLDFLAVADPVTLSPLLVFPARELLSTARVYRRARPLLGDDPQANAAYLQEAVYALTGTAAEAEGIRPRYHTRLASVRRDDSLLTLTGHTGQVKSVAIGSGPDERPLLVSASRDRRVQIWDPLSGARVGKPLGDDGGAVSSVALGAGPDGRLLLATGGGWDRTVQVWDPLAGDRIGEPLTGHTGGVSSVAFGAGRDGRLLLASGSDDYTVRVWDPRTGVMIGEPLTGHTGGVSSVAFGADPDGRLLLASGSRDRTVRLWDPDTGIPVGGPLTGHGSWVNSVAFGAGRDGRLLLASGSDDFAVRVWDPRTGVMIGEPLTGHEHVVTSVAFGAGPDGRLLVSGSRDGTVRVWDPDTGAMIGEPLTGHTAGVSSVTLGVGPHGRPLLGSGSEDYTVRIWDPLSSAATGGSVAGQTEAVSTVALGTDRGGRLLLASGSRDRTVRVWDPLTGDEAGQPLTGHAGWVNSVALGASRDGPLRLASGSYDHTVRVWDPLTGAMVAGPLTGHTATVSAVALGTGRDGRLLLASGSWDKTVQIWDPDTGATIGAPLTGHTATVSAVAFGTGPDGRLLLATGSSDHTVRVWDPDTGAMVAGPLTGHTAEVTSVALGTGPDGRLLLASGGWDQEVRVWDPLSGEPAGGPLAGHAGRVTSLAFDTDPERHPLLVSGGQDRTVRWWDLATGTCLVTLQRRSGVQSVATADRALAIGEYEGVYVIELDRRVMPWPASG